MKILFITFQKKDDENQPNFYRFTDYLGDLTLHGFRELYGEDVIDYPGSWHLYKDEAEKRKINKDIIWGRGFTYTNILDNFDNINREDIKNKIKSNYFELIVYGSIRRSDLFLDIAVNSKSKIIFIDGHDDTYIEKKFLKHGLYFKREYIETTKNVESINFSVPKSKILKSIDMKPIHLVAPLIPGKSKTYIYKNEEDYYKMYQKSIFGITYKKTGWDCMRHYEILMNGCLPLFLDIENCPDLTMKNLPKKKITEIKKNYEFILNKRNPFKIFIKRFQKKTILIEYLKYLFSAKISAEEFLLKNPEIFETKEDILSFTKKNLTTEITAKNILSYIK
tara:strand:+ start:1483 stop:2490 length:1008 start_codon:yes stop_codon:yes gene_type:complete